MASGSGSGASGNGGDAVDRRRQIAARLRAYTSDEVHYRIREHLQRHLHPVVPHPIIHRRAVIPQDHVAAHRRLFEDYFTEEPRFGDNFFRRRFRMHWPLFMSIVNVLERRYNYFRFRKDASGRPGHTPIQKCTTAIRQLAYGGATDMFDEYLHIGETTTRECLMYFCQGVIEIYRERYLRKATPEDCQTQMDMHENQHGFLRMLGSIDCPTLTDWTNDDADAAGQATAWPPPIYEWGYLMGTPIGSVHLPTCPNKKPIFDSRMI
ncbi:uncharacterized protein LOC121780193 [Salvia splendens]|uniref:uncharacterized protein LOC121780193 n=1 Tax=Salvia splendens TaxID=180675 RepID=UPI001C26859A|nr:uncharacterized protein LOC121780193 [Salvia splendens]